MIIHLASDASPLVRAAAGTALALHISGASAGLSFGSVALLARKGQRLHRVAGNIFFVSMLTMSAVAAVAAPFLPDRASALMGVLVFYLTATAWAVVQRGPGVIGRFERGAAVVPWLVVAGYFTFAWVGGHMPRGVLDGEPSQMGYVFGALAVLAGACDVSMIRRGGVTGRQRTARHLWRMALALAIAWLSFAGQPKAQPIALRGSDLLMLPALAVLIGLFYWLVRTLHPRRRAPAGAVAVAA